MVKMARLLQSLVRDMNNWCLWGNRPAKIKNSTKESKDSDKNKSFHNSSANLASGRKSGQPLNHSQGNSSGYLRGGGRSCGHSYWRESFNRQSGQENHTGSSNTLATGVNASALKDKEKSISKIICFYCNKNGHFANICTKPPKAKN